MKRLNLTIILILSCPLFAVGQGLDIRVPTDTRGWQMSPALLMKANFKTDSAHDFSALEEQVIAKNKIPLTEARFQHLSKLSRGGELAWRETFTFFEGRLIGFQHTILVPSLEMDSLSAWLREQERALGDKENVLHRAFESRRSAAWDYAQPNLTYTMKLLYDENDRSYAVQISGRHVGEARTVNQYVRFLRSGINHL